MKTAQVIMATGANAAAQAVTAGHQADDQWRKELDASRQVKGGAHRRVAHLRGKQFGENRPIAGEIPRAHPHQEHEGQCQQGPGHDIMPEPRDGRQPGAAALPSPRVRR